VNRRWIEVVTLVVVVLLAACQAGDDEAVQKKVKVVMSGRSTMGLWFKHWNWPKILRLRGTYRNWPIAYETYERDGLELLYRPLQSPGSRDGGDEWGARMLVSFREALDNEAPDVAFFKFCFVDFNLKGAPVEERLADMMRTVSAAHELCRERGVRLVAGNAIPLGEPAPESVLLQREFNQWLQAYAEGHDDMIVFDFYGVLADEEGALPRSLWRSSDDIHPHDKAYDLLDQLFFTGITPWIRESNSPADGGN
jgi:hypothetical protein